jgi:hypothetical protein
LEIDPSSAQLAIDFVKFTMLVQETQVAQRMGDSDFDRQAQETLRVIRNAGVRGRTHAELAEASRMFRALKPSEQDAVMDSIKRRDLVSLVQYKPSSGKGKPRMAWVAAEFVVPPIEDEESQQS